jgi:hypothetical protein
VALRVGCLRLARALPPALPCTPGRLSREAAALLDAPAAAALKQQHAAAHALAAAARAAHGQQRQQLAAAAAASAATTTQQQQSSGRDQPEAAVAVRVPRYLAASAARSLAEGRQQVLAGAITPQVEALLASVQQQQAALTDAMLQQQQQVAAALQVCRAPAGVCVGCVVHPCAACLSGSPL